MINRYEGNTGRVVRMPEAGDLRPPPPMPAPPFPPPRRVPPPGGDPLSRLLAGLGELESNDLLMLLILFLLYRDSGDKDLLLIMAAAFLM
jgi:hypothetical protein